MTEMMNMTKIIKSDLVYLNVGFGIEQDRIVKGLLAIRKKLCCYMGPPCDCKYGYDPDDTPYSEQTGCPEIALAASIISRMTPEEYTTFMERKPISMWRKLIDEEENDKT